MRRLIPVLLLAFTTAACGGSEPATAPADTPEAAPAAEVEATSLLGTPLVRMTDFPNREQLDANLAAAEAESAANPDSVDALIWLGRRQAYLWRYREALETFSQGVTRFPDDPRVYRHRGHRYITLRDFDAAVVDFEKAASLFAGQPDEIEPDGQPNALNQPLSTLQFNVWYHLALAHYLSGNFEQAARAYDECMKVSTNDDLLVATADWYWMTLMRLDRKAEADAILARITPEMNIVENTSYHRRLLMYKGIETPEALLDTTTADDLTIATQGYGVGNWHLVNGDQAKAREIFERVVAGRSWSAFGYIAAEADLARMR